jgi:hypothetical protein
MPLKPIVGKTLKIASIPCLHDIFISQLHSISALSALNLYIVKKGVLFTFIYKYITRENLQSS